MKRIQRLNYLEQLILLQNTPDIKIITGVRRSENYDKDYQLMGKYKAEKDLFFFSIANLCYGKYVIKLSQYNKEDNNIFISDYIEFNFNR